MSQNDTKRNRRRGGRRRRDATAVVTQLSGFYRVTKLTKALEQKERKREEMASGTKPITVRLLTFAAFALIAVFVPVRASTESTRTVDLDIRPGGVVETFTQAIVSYWNSHRFYY